MGEKKEKLLYEKMLLIRRAEEAIADHYHDKGMRCPVHLCIGQEAVAAGVSATLKMTDKVFSNHRAHGHYLAKGGNLNSMIAELYGRETGCCGGRGGSMHMVDLNAGFLGATPIVGGTVPLAVGSAWATKLQKKDDVTVVYFGDGCFEEGVLHEAMNFAVLHSLPILFVCENNNYSVYTSRDKRQPNRPIYEIAKAHGIKSEYGNGNDVEAVFDLSACAVSNLRNGLGPWFLEFSLFRWREHCGPDYDHHMNYRSISEIKAGLSSCPIEAYEKVILNRGYLTNESLKKIEDEVKDKLISAFSLAWTDRKPTTEDARAYVYA